LRVPNRIPPWLSAETSYRRRSHAGQRGSFRARQVVSESVLIAFHLYE